MTIILCFPCHRPQPCSQCGERRGFGSSPVAVCHCGSELYPVFNVKGKRTGLTHPYGDDEERCLDGLRSMRVERLGDEDLPADA